MKNYVVSVMVKTARDSMFLMSDDLPYEDASYLLDTIEEEIMNDARSIRLSQDCLIPTANILSVRLMPAEQKGGKI